MTVDTGQAKPAATEPAPEVKPVSQVLSSALAKPVSKAPPSALEKQILAVINGCVVCGNVRLGDIVSRGRDWTRKGEYCDAGSVIGYLDLDGTRTGIIPDVNIKPYKDKGIAGGLCVVKWANGMVMISSIGYRGIYELMFAKPRPAMAEYLGETPRPPAIRTALRKWKYCDCHNSWLPTCKWIFRACRELGWQQHASAVWFVNKKGEDSFRPAGEAMVGFSDCFTYSLCNSNMPGKMWLEHKVPLTTIAGALMPLTYRLDADGSFSKVAYPVAAGWSRPEGCDEEAPEDEPRQWFVSLPQRAPAQRAPARSFRRTHPLVTPATHFNLHLPS